MKSHSQAGQDLWIAAIFGGKRNGLFLDVGSSHPSHWSNTFSLEKELSWSGLLIDGDQKMIDLCRAQRSSQAVCADARTFTWQDVREITGAVVDYASVDIDEWTHEALKNLLHDGPMIRAMTVEHDRYQRGDKLRTPNRALMAERNFELIAGDVHSNGCAYEDWYVYPGLVDMQVANRFRSDGLDWEDVLERGGAL